MRTLRPVRALLAAVAAGGLVALVGCGGDGGGATPTATQAPPTPTAMTPTVTSPATAAVPTVATVAPSPTAAPATPTPTPCPSYTLVPQVGALGANIAAAASRWNTWLGCPVFAVGTSGIPVDFAPAEIGDPGWGQYAGGQIYLMPPSSTPADDPSTPYANDFERLTCVVMHALGHVLGHADGSTAAPKIMRPLDWPTWPPTSCSTPDSP